MIIIRQIAQLAEILLGLRTQRAVSQDDLGFAAGVDGGQVSKYERGFVVPNVMTMIRLLGALGYRLVAIPTLFADTAAERDAVVAAAVSAYMEDGHERLTDLRTAVELLVAAELRHRDGRPS